MAGCLYDLNDGLMVSLVTCLEIKTCENECETDCNLECMFASAQRFFWKTESAGIYVIERLN